MWLLNNKLDFTLKLYKSINYTQKNFSDAILKIVSKFGIEMTLGVVHFAYYIERYIKRYKQLNIYNK